MSHPRDREPAAEDLDPTGVRALLSSLPDPGPMPHDLADRITASLRQEQEQRAEGSRVTPLPTRGDRAAPHHWLAAAAAVAAVAVAGTVIFQSALGDQAWDSVAAFYSGDVGTESSDSGADAAAGGADAAEREESGGEVAGEDGREVTPLSGIQVVPEPTALVSDTFEVGAGAVLSAATGLRPSEQADEAAGSGDTGATLTSQTAADCVAAVGADPASGSWVVGPATLDGAPAVLVIADARAPALAWAVAPDCAEGDDGAVVLHGPVSLP